MPQTVAIIGADVSGQGVALALGNQPGRPGYPGFEAGRRTGTTTATAERKQHYGTSIPKPCCIARHADWPPTETKIHEYLLGLPQGNRSQCATARSRAVRASNHRNAVAGLRLDERISGVSDDERERNEERSKRDWQRRFGSMPREQALQWRRPVLSLSAMIAKAEVDAILWSRRTHALHQGALKNHAGYNALARLFANGVRVAKEIGSLIGNGYPEGATARWRTLHETTVVAQFIRTSPPSIGERYRDHNRIQQYRAMNRVKALSEQYDKHLPPGFFAIYEKLRDERDALIQKYGPEFNTEYGWAAPAIEKTGRRGPRISELEVAVGMDHMRQAYANASQHIHSGPDSVSWYLDPAEGDDMRHVFGPDADGSSLPGILVSHTLSNLRIVWRAANATDNPFMAPDQLEKDVTRIHDEGTDLIKEFVDCERSVEHLILATQLVETLRKG